MTSKTAEAGSPINVKCQTICSSSHCTLLRTSNRHKMTPNLKLVIDEEMKINYVKSLFSADRFRYYVKIIGANIKLNYCSRLRLDSYVGVRA